MIRTDGVLGADAGPYWPRVAEWCEAALASSGGLLALADIQAAVACRDMQLWVVSDDDGLRGVCVTEISVWPRAKVLTVVIVAGDAAAAWFDALHETLSRFAVAQGCDQLMTHARRGAGPHLRQRGWTELNVTFIKELAHGQHDQDHPVRDVPG